MRKIYFIIALLTSLLVVNSCATVRYGSPYEVLEIPTISNVLMEYYPHLYEYYLEGVLDVVSLKEIPLEDGTFDYKLKYKLIKYRYTDYDLKMEMLQLHFPEVYEAYMVGAIVINDFYKYVDRSTGLVTHHVSYSPMRDYYYHNRVGLYFGNRYYMRRYMPVPQPRPRPEYRPNNEPSTRPSNPPRQQPNIRPNNPPRDGNQGGRPSTPPQSNNRGGQGRRR